MQAQMHQLAEECCPFFLAVQQVAFSGVAPGAYRDIELVSFHDRRVELRSLRNQPTSTFL